MNARFTRLEDRMEALVEGTFARLFAGGVHPRDVARHLARAMEDSTVAGVPATHYVVYLHPADAAALQAAEPPLAPLLANELLRLAREAQLTLPESPQVELQADPTQKPHIFAVSADTPLPPTGDTQTMAPLPASAGRQPPRAFLILEGERTVTLSLAVVNVGRRFDCDIILDDPRVSRSHAQLRLRFGHYMLYDLGSTGGTFVNGQRVSECVLRPGDVISLGGVPIIYGEDATGEPPPRSDTQGSTRALPGHTAPLPPPPPTRP
jgi:hypothetical protein